MSRLLANRKSRSDERGATLWEFGMGFWILVLFFTGTYQFGYGIYTYNALENAVRAGAEYAAMQAYDSSTSTPSSAFLTQVRNVVVYGDPDGTNTTPVVPGLTASQVVLTVTFASRVPTTMSVKINGYSINAIFGSFTMNNKPEVTMPYMGRYAP